jgi:hypothetical protein
MTSETKTLRLSSLKNLKMQILLTIWNFSSGIKAIRKMKRLKRRKPIRRYKRRRESQNRVLDSWFRIKI